MTQWDHKMKTLAIDCRMARMSGIGVYLRNLVPLCMNMMPFARFRLIGYNDQFIVPARCEWEPASCSAPIYSISEQYKLLPLLKGCNALWTPHYPIPIMSPVPMVVTVHDVAHLALRDLYKGITHLYAKFMFQFTRFKAKEIIFVSEFTRQEFLRRVGEPKGNTTVIPNGINNCWLESPLQDRSEPPYFLAVGNIKPHKNIPFLCRAFSKIASRCCANLILVGESSGFRVSERSTDNLAEICPGRISFTGFLSQKELTALVSKAAALVFPSRYEGFGLPLLEALGAGVPVIASDTQVSREVCSDHAMYFPLNSEEKLADLLLDALAITSERRRYYGEYNRIWASCFTWEKAAELTTQILCRILGSNL